MITILIRTSNRPTFFARCLRSIQMQTYKNTNIIVSYDTEVKPAYIPDFIKTIQVFPDRSKQYFYDLYCNDLMQQVPSTGWFFFLDDDDYLNDENILERVSAFLNPPFDAVLFQFMRNGYPKPFDGVIKEGKVGLPCIFVRSIHKNLATLDGQTGGDYRFIRDIWDRTTLRNFVPLPVVHTDRRSLGMME